jgi:FtsH-binding integral membrane protein
MEEIFLTLESKTYFILSIQLFITWVAAQLTLLRFHKLYLQGMPWITATKNKQGQIDLDIDFLRIKLWFWILMVIDIIVFLVLFFWGQNQELSVSMAIFSVWSLITGVQVALALVSVDENLGARILAITASIVFAAALINAYSGIDFSFLGLGLFIALCLLILFNIVRLFVAMPRMITRVVAGIGVVIFTLYLLYDFSRLEELQEAGYNDWPTATNIAIHIYLDIINLFLELLDALSS